MDTLTKILNDRDKILFEKALKLYFYLRQQDVKKLNSQIRERFSYGGQVAYSLITTYISEGNLKLEYMDFLNEELKTMRALDDQYLEPLMIKPHEIDEIEFNQVISIKVFDEDRNADLVISYDPDEGIAKLAPVN
jgi:GTPase